MKTKRKTSKTMDWILGLCLVVYVIIGVYGILYGSCGPAQHGINQGAAP